MSSTTRVVLRVGGALTILVGLIALAFAVRMPGSGHDTSPIQVTAGQTVTLPRPGLFAGSLTVYGAVTSGATPPTAKELGCTVTQPSGRTEAAAGMAWVGHSTQTVAGRTLTPLVEIGRYTSGTTLRCSGPAATSASPLSILSGGRSSGLARVVLVGFGVLAAIVGGVGVLVLRPRRPNAT